MTGTEIIYGGYSPGVIGRITELHAVYYREHWNFDIRFETQVGRELSVFLRDFSDGRDFFRTAAVGGRFAGSIAIDGKEAASDGARLRWFIVEPEFQRRGIGRRLIREAVGFYESEGFKLNLERDGSPWGHDITEQMFTLELKC